MDVVGIVQGLEVAAAAGLVYFFAFEQVALVVLLLREYRGEYTVDTLAGFGQSASVVVFKGSFDGGGG
ncbi:MAG: hypothetical protein SFV55_27200 [Haliscomenobacter sp.]|uniref:hypothetical protein n=1 Tax=Haliscomenobacter sp. TaxID=2717303 RepID=UPI0029A67609|nr:hypothetical protein [Haliscomenobacter sp.]MDX2072152.1 hypothetical protein [Haliscomenobacter sp.]